VKLKLFFYHNHLLAYRSCLQSSLGYQSKVFD
jgi:hypothetical protein